MKTLPRLIPLFLLAASWAAAQAPPLPVEWREDDWAVPPARYAVEVARFPSTDLATGVQSALRNQGWAPVKIVPAAPDVAVVVGNFDSAAEAHWLAMELSALRTAQGVPASLPAGTPAAEVEVDGPVIAPFLPTPGVGPKALGLAGAIREARLQRDEILPAELELFDKAMAELELATEAEGRGPQAAVVARVLWDARVAPEAALHLAGLVARGEWEAPDRLRLDAGEVAADILHQVRRDWRAAWSATESLLSEHARSPEGVLRDKLRRAALMVEVAASGHATRPSFAQVRAAIRAAWDEPVDAPELRIKLELVYLQTFAWQGRWGRVEEVGRDFATRAIGFPHERALGRLLVARSLERTRRHDDALAIIQQVISTEFPRDAQPLRLGAQERDLHAEARRLAAKFRELKIREEEGLVPEEPAAPAIAEEDEAAPQAS